MDDKYGSEHQASDLAVWSDDVSAPNYGVILRVCQDGLEAASGSGGVRGAHIEQTVALQAGRTYVLGFWAAAFELNSEAPECAAQAAPAQALQVQVYGQSSGELLNEAAEVAACSASYGSTQVLSVRRSRCRDRRAEVPLRIVLGLAHALTADGRYLADTTAAVDCVLGNNPLQRSYVTGYGTRAVSKIHHTMFAP